MSGNTTVTSGAQPQSLAELCADLIGQALVSIDEPVEDRMVELTFANGLKLRVQSPADHNPEGNITAEVVRP